MKIRLAENEDGPRVRQLVAEAQADIEGLDWSSIYPHWIVAEKDGKIAGCINVAVSKPIGRLDFLAVDPALRPHARGKVVRALINQGLATLTHVGCSASVSQIPFGLQAYKKVLKRHFGAIVIGQGNMVLRGL